MKKIVIVLVALIVIVMTSCCGIKKTKDGSVALGYGNDSNPYVVVIDSCEYVVWGYGMAHKGNCKYCEERHTKEYETFLEDIVIELY